MRVNIVTGDGIKHKYTVENLDSAMDIIKDYAKEHNFTYNESDELIPVINNNEAELLKIVSLFKHTDNGKHFEGNAFIWSK